MKTFLAVFIGKEDLMKKWNQLSKEEQQSRTQKGMLAWQQWGAEH